MGNASAFELNALDTRIRELVAYARERDGEDRTLLFRNLVDLFLTDKAPKKQPTRDQLLDVIEALLSHVDPDGRRTVADLVANMSEPPIDLAMRLAKDEPEIIGDLLRTVSFDEEDILALIETTGRDHHHVIASRADLSANIWIALARATPAAPKIEDTPTLSLWSDTLGGTAATNSHATKSNRPVVRAVATIPGVDGEVNGVAETDASVQTSGSGVEPRQAATLRILRTDKDLIAERIEKSAEAMTTAQDVEATGGKESQPGTNQSTEDAPLLNEPGPGGWSWRSDRDGFVTEISKHGQKLFGDDASIIGSAILDMLGLNVKLGHPVSRAFQRRSTIHDAPLTIEALADGSRFWTMEATPVFSANSGIFEGYEGTMTPVISAADDEPDLFTSPEPPVDLFLDDAAAAKNTPEAATPKKPNPAAANEPLTDENIDRTAVPAPVSQPTQKTGAPSADKNPIADLATGVLQEVIGQSLAASAKAADRQQKSADMDDEIAATLQILEQALNALLVAGKEGSISSVRLQAEIASACLRTLKDQLR